MPQPKRGFRKWKKIGIVGSRRRANFADRIVLEQLFIKIYKDGDKIISGGCKLGGDHFAEGLARKYNAPIIIFPADWEQYGQSAGHLRNSLIAEECDMLLALVAKDRTGGTEDTIKKVVRLNKICLLILYDGTVIDGSLPTKQETPNASTETEQTSSSE